MSSDDLLTQDKDDPTGIRLRKRPSEGSNRSMRDLSTSREVNDEGDVKSDVNRCPSTVGSNASTSFMKVEGHGSQESDAGSKTSPLGSQRPQRNAYRKRLDEESLKEYNNMVATASSSWNDSQSVRRSTRARVIKYANMNEKLFAYRGDYREDKPRSSRSGMKRRRDFDSDSEESVEVMPARTTTRTSRYSFRQPLVDDRVVDNDQDDMYSRVKSNRRSAVKQRNFRQEEESDTDTEVDQKDELAEFLDDDNQVGETVKTEPSDSTGRSLRRRTVRREVSSDEEEDKVSVKKYSLRERKARPVFEALPRALRRKPPTDRSQHSLESFSNNFRKRSNRRKAARHGSSSDSSSSDESHFQRKKANKMSAMRNQCLPLNFKRSDLLQGSLKERLKVGSSLADIEPMTIDTSVTFNSIGGLGKHLNSLKEMVIFPLVYPEVFEKFKVQVPRGVLFHGPPGTGKTLVARALANECSTESKKVAFFMRKGADCMSKWVGESERQLRLLFDQAYLMRPSIIFFDEIDGIAPVRSTRQDQIHSSIVSTLLALMDGLDSRGEVIVIGATNRIEAIDPALRRPGRFDREFLFPLPSTEARKEILSIHTKSWSPLPSPQLLESLADRTVGYCGADLKALCSEAVLLALKRKYQQIYTSKSKLKLDYDSIEVTLKEFNTAISKKIVPAAQRSVTAVAKPLPVIMRPLLIKYLSTGLTHLKTIFPIGFSKATQRDRTADDLLDSDDDVDEQLLCMEAASSNKGNNQSLRFAGIFRPRLLFSGDKNLGQGYVATALMQELEQLNHFNLNNSCSTEQLNAWFSEAVKRLPTASVLYCPKIEGLHDDLFTLLCSLLDGIDATIPILFIATSEISHDQLPSDVLDLFSKNKFTTKSIELTQPNEEDRLCFFLPLFEKYIKKPVEVKVKKELEVLEKVPLQETRKLSEKELTKLKRKEDVSLRQLRNFLRELLGKLIRNKMFSIFCKPVDVEEVTDYYEVIKEPMDLETMMFKIDNHQYETARQFLGDIDLITNNALEYNPARDSHDRHIRHRACALRDMAREIIDNELDSDFEEMCQEMHDKRKERGEEARKDIPKMLVKPIAVVEPQQPTVNTVRPDEDTEVESLHEHDQPKLKANPIANPVETGIIAKTPSSSYRRKGKKKRTRVTLSCTASSSNQSVDLAKSDESNDATVLSVSLDKSESMDTETTQESTDKSVDVPETSSLSTSGEVVIPQEGLDKLLKEVVVTTNGCTVEQLENLYWTLFRTMRSRIRETDRTVLIEVS